MDSVNFTNCDF